MTATLTNSSAMISFTGVGSRLAFAYSYPYSSFGLTNVMLANGWDLYGAKIHRERHFRACLETYGPPDLMLMSNFILNRAGVVALCRERAVNVLHTEDGFFPHYNQAHAGAVTTGTPSVQYAFADGSDNHIRPTGLTYPDGRDLNYSYGD